MLILATGFASAAIGNGDPAMRAGVQVTGTGGRTLSSKWQTQGPTTLYGVMSNGFPNMFWINLAQSAAVSIFLHLILTSYFFGF